MFPLAKAPRRLPEAGVGVALGTQKESQQEFVFKLGLFVCLLMQNVLSYQASRVRQCCPFANAHPNLAKITVECLKKYFFFKGK